MMLIKQGAGFSLLDSLNNGRALFFVVLSMCLACSPHALYGATQTEPETITYSLSVTDFAASFIEIPTSTVSGSSPTLDSSYLAGMAPIYDVNNVKVGTCSASFLSMQTADGIFTDISNYLATDSGLIVTWFTPTKLLNLEVDTIVNSMVTECTVVVTTKIGLSPFFGKTFNLVVSSDSGRIYFKFTRIGTIF